MSEFTLNPLPVPMVSQQGLMVIRAYHESRGDSKRVKQ